MTTTKTGLTPADVAHLTPADYRDSCEECMRAHTDRGAYVATPVRLKPTTNGVTVHYSHHCGNTWTTSWMVQN